MRMLFLYALPHRHERRKYERGLVPSHRLWGQIELEKRGHQTELCPDPPRFLLRFGGSIAWRLWQSIWVIRKASNVDALVAVHEVSALVLLMTRFIGLARAPLLILNFALLHPRQTKGVRASIWRLALRNADRVVSLAANQMERLRDAHGVAAERAGFLRMPVDALFFEDVDGGEEERLCVAVGTNDGKDFETLVAALPLGERLVVVTDGMNAQKIRAHPFYGSGIDVQEAVPMVELRKWYQRAAVVVIPLAETPHGSGHTVFVEAQAMGKVVIVSGAENMRDYAEDGWNAVVVRPGDALAMRRALQSVLNEPQRYLQMRRRARQWARMRFSVERFAQGLERMLRKARAQQQSRLERDGRTQKGGSEHAYFS